uniref:Uncharacterized protein n=1 Tax=Stomoxys calcitrans TaxID=35570 RepID=A0A1I8PT86_STOCA
MQTCGTAKRSIGRRISYREIHIVKSRGYYGKEVRRRSSQRDTWGYEPTYVKSALRVTDTGTSVATQYQTMNQIWGVTWKTIKDYALVKKTDFGVKRTEFRKIEIICSIIKVVREGTVINCEATSDSDS